MLPENTAAKDRTFCSDELPVAEAVAFTGVRLMRHQQVTDAYLLGLAIRRGGILATLDQRIAALTDPMSAERKALEMVAWGRRRLTSGGYRGGVIVNLVARGSTLRLGLNILDA